MNQEKNGFSNEALKDMWVCKLSLQELLWRIENEDVRESALEALSAVDALSRPDFFALIESIDDWRIQWALMRFWVIVRERR